MKAFVVIRVTEDEIEVEKVFLDSMSCHEWFKDRPDYQDLVYFDGSDWAPISLYLGDARFLGGPRPCAERLEIHSRDDVDSPVGPMPELILQEIEVSS